MKVEVSRFDWDDGNREKGRKHGVSAEDIEHLLKSGPRIVPDPKHSQEEDRFVAVGRSMAGRPMFVVFTLRREGRQEAYPASDSALHALR